MPLFNKKYIKKQIGEHPNPIPQDHFEALDDWARMIKNGIILSMSETQLNVDFKTRFLEKVLGYIGPTSKSSWSWSNEAGIGRGAVDLALGTFTKDTSKIIAPFELKGAKTKDLDAIMHGRNKSPVQQAWQYANGVAGCSWVLVCNYTELRLYSYTTGNQDYEVFFLKDLVDPVEYARFQMLLSAENLIKGRTLEHLAASQREEKDITIKLYADYKAIRHTLIDQVQLATPESDGETQIAYAQTILDRVLFIAFAEDTGLLPQHSLKNAFEHEDPYKPKPVWDTFKGLFKAIDKGNTALNIPRYNGGLFKRHPAIDKLKLPDLVCEGFKRLGDYDFASEVSVTILGHIFEQSITDLERLQAISRGEEVEPEKKTGTTGKRKLAGVVYTPDYIARFIVEQTLGTHLKELFHECLKPHVLKESLDEPYEKLEWLGKPSELKVWQKYQEKIRKLRIVDPACGSGVFLVTAFDYLKEEIYRVNLKLGELEGGSGYIQTSVIDINSDILSKNLYGVDVNAESVEITKLSLWLKTARRGKVLDSLDGHLAVGDSIIEDSNYAYMEHGFSWKEAFPKVFKDGGFDIVLGNPPYVRQELISPMKPYLQKQFEVYHGVADLYCYFFERGVRLLKDGGRVGYISNATFFKTASGKPLRKFLSEKTTLETIVNFGDTQVFEGVTTYPAIMVMKSQAAPKKHNLSFWNVDELPKANFSESFDNLKAEYAQKNLKSDAWELEDERLTTLRQKIKKGKKTLKEVYGSPYRGVLTGRNEVFVIDQATRDRLITEDAKSAEIIKPFLVGKDLKKWRIENQNLFLIFSRRGTHINDYPAILAYLNSYRGILEPKPENWKPASKGEKWLGRKSGNYKWYEIQDTVDYYPEFNKPKVAYNRFLDRAQFLYDESQTYINDAPYFIPNGDLYLCALLNSKISWMIIVTIATKLSGGFFQLHAQYVETLPIPKATDVQKAELAELAKACQAAAEARYAKQQSVTRRIPDLCPHGNDPKLSNKLKSWWEFEDFKAFQKEIKSRFKQDIPLSERTQWEDWIAKEKAEINRLTAEIKANENKINTLVYHLFDLTDEEIELLEANV